MLHFGQTLRPIGFPCIEDIEDRHFSGLLVFGCFIFDYLRSGVQGRGHENQAPDLIACQLTISMHPPEGSVQHAG